MGASGRAIPSIHLLYSISTFMYFVIICDTFTWAVQALSVSPWLSIYLEGTTVELGAVEGCVWRWPGGGSGAAALPESSIAAIKAKRHILLGKRMHGGSVSLL